MKHSFKIPERQSYVHLVKYIDFRSEAIVKYIITVQRKDAGLQVAGEEKEINVFSIFATRCAAS